MLQFDKYAEVTSEIDRCNWNLDYGNVGQFFPFPQCPESGWSAHISYFHHLGAQYKNMIRNRYALEHTIITEGIGL